MSHSFLSKSMATVALLLGGCASVGPTDAPPAEPSVAITPAPMNSNKRAAAPARATTVDAYKQEVARRIVESSGGSFEGSLPMILKSVVVLDITVDGEGKPTRVSVHRSNGFKELERIAIDSVRRAGPLPAPTAAMLRGRTSVSYMETFLFRDDGKYQIRSLVTEPQPGWSATTSASTGKI